MKKRIFSAIASVAAVCTMMSVSVLNVDASSAESKIVDGSYLTNDEKSEGHSTNNMMRGYYLMDGECSISRAGLTRVYAYGSTSANQTVNYLATLVFVDQYIEETDEWGQVYGWSEEAFNNFYMSTAKSVTVDRGYYYRVRAHHLAGDQAPYDETASFTNGIFVPN